MTTGDRFGSDGEGLAALEYVLALEAPAERRRFEAALLDDPFLAQAVWREEERLRPLADAVPVRPAGRRAFAGIEARLFGTEAAAERRLRRAVRFWRGLAVLLALAMLGAAAAVVLVAASPDIMRPPESMWLAAIVRSDDAVALVRVREDGRLVARRFPHDDAGSAELWLQREGASPVSLGLLSADRSELMLSPAAQDGLSDGAQLVITQEPEGGSPTGAPTGPLLGSGRLTRI